jgi:N-acetylglucosaminyldiphosphoundecaprenol N-acetyl-beta-D-mannosaminyltransferase
MMTSEAINMTEPVTIERIEFLGMPLDTGVAREDVCDLIATKGRLRLVTFINPLAWRLAIEHPEYLPALKSMTYVLPDGEGVARACRLLTEKPCPRISFDMTSLADEFFKRATVEGASIMIVGGHPGVDEGVQGKLVAKYRDIKIAGTAHGYDDFEPKIADVIEKQPDIVVVGMGSPRQENFLIALRDAGFTGLAITCGGFFDQYLESDEYYPSWVDHWNLRFAWRLCMEPRRLWRRYLIDYQTFIRIAGEALFRKFAPPAVLDYFDKNKAS